VEIVGRVCLRFIAKDCSGAVFADPFKKLTAGFGSIADTEAVSPVSS
jgi:hypothetical protein